jgi:hypothetical protein
LCLEFTEFHMYVCMYIIFNNLIFFCLASVRLSSNPSATNKIIINAPHVTMTMSSVRECFLLLKYIQLNNLK